MIENLARHAKQGRLPAAKAFVGVRNFDTGKPGDCGEAANDGE
jgi:hypothetical protein